MREVKIGGSEADQRFNKFLNRYLPGAGSGFLYKMLRKKNILLNGKKAEGREILREGDRIQIYFSEETLDKFSIRPDEADGVRSRCGDRGGRGQEEGGGDAAGLGPEGFCRSILLENKDLLIWNKPAGLLSQRAAAGDVSVNELLRDYLIRSGQMTGEDFRFYRPGVINRLDRNTSGLILAGKTLRGSRILSEAVRTRRVGKFYLALVRGLPEKEGLLEGWISKDAGKNRVMVADIPSPGADHILTRYERVGSFFGGDSPHEGSLVRIELITGKSHQIRAHMASIGHPLAGDPKYGDRDWNRWLSRRFHLERQFLHAEGMVFSEEDAGSLGLDRREITAPLPADLQHLFDSGIMLMSGILTGNREIGKI